MGIHVNLGMSSFSISKPIFVQIFLGGTYMTNSCQLCSFFGQNSLQKCDFGTSLYRELMVRKMAGTNDAPPPPEEVCHVTYFLFFISQKNIEISEEI